MEAVLISLCASLTVWAIIMWRRLQQCQTLLATARTSVEFRASQNAKAELLESLFFEVFDHVPEIGAAYVSMDGVILKCNKAFLEISGQPEATGKTWMEITHPDDEPLDRAACRSLVAGEHVSYKMTKRYVNGNVVSWVVLYVTLKTEREDWKFVVLIRRLEDKEARKVEVQYYD